MTAGQVMWPWRGAKAAPACRPRAGFAAAVPFAVSAVLLALGHRTAALVVAGIGVVLLLLALAAPAAFAAFHRAMQRFGHGVGVAMSWLLLTPFYYLVFAPGRLLVHLSGKDPMRRRFPAPESTCWDTRLRDTSPERFRRQY